MSENYMRHEAEYEIREDLRIIKTFLLLSFSLPDIRVQERGLHET